MLAVRDKMTLDLEAVRFAGVGAKESHIAYVFSERPTAYYQRLNRLLDDPEALAYAPLTVKRLRRLRDERRRVRATRRHAWANPVWPEATGAAYLGGTPVARSGEA